MLRGNCMDKPLTIKVAASTIGLSEDALRKAARNGTIPCLKIGNRYLFYLDQVLDLLRSQAQTNVKQGGE
jgi:excisionase family DNA binding protein